MELIKKDKQWVVIDDRSGEGNTFDSIEEAADILVKLGINDDEIDAAICDLTAREKNTAIFGVNGTFICSK